MIDIGVNLTDASFATDRQEVINRAIKANVGTMIITGTDINSSTLAHELCQASNHNQITSQPKVLYSTAGLHPHHASDYAHINWHTFEQLWQSSSVVAIGETGLDYNRNFSSPKEQLKSFEHHLQAACQLPLPLFLHERDAHADFYNLLSHYRPKLKMTPILHCFTGDTQWLNKLKKLDIYFGVTGWLCDPKRGQNLRQALPHIPMNRLLIETDAPYLLPKTLPKDWLIQGQHKQRRNEPAYLPYIAEQIALLTQQPYEQIIEATTYNALGAFNLTT